MNPLILKLEGFQELSEHDREVLQAITVHSRTVEAKQDLIAEGDVPADVHLVLDGFAYRYKLLADGRRQIFSYLIPGDFCDLHVFILDAMDHNIGTLTPCIVVDIPRHTILDLTENHPRIARALWWASLVDEAVLREWLTNIGQRPAVRRIAHLLCEMLVRLEAVGLVDDGHYELPLTQTELGETMGLSMVHVNRVLKELRERGLVRMTGKSVWISNIDALKAFGEFNPNYLHYARESRNRQRAASSPSGLARGR